jgi:flagellar basal body-associated protein FliL
MKSKKTLIILIAALVLVLLIGVGVTYAYFVGQISGNETSTTITATAGTMTLVVAGGNSITADNISPSGNAFATKTFTVTGNNTTNNQLTYNLNLVIDQNTFIAGSIKYTLTSTNTSSNGKEVTTIADQKDIATGTGTIYLGMGYFTNGTGKVHTYVLNLYFPETNTNQSANMGATIKAHISVEAPESYVASPGIAATVLKDLAGHTTGGGGLKTIAHTATGNQTYATTDYRYYGSNPNNYVQFNDELWRIIGVFEVEDDTSTKAYRVKLIRNELIGLYSYDTSASTINNGNGINEWSQADLMKLLNPGYESNQDLNNSGTTITVNNSLYWTKGSGTCYNGQSNATTTCDFTSTGLGATAKSMIDKTKYYIGGWDDYNTTSTQFYTYERGSNVIASSTDGVTRTTTWTGYVGLPYISDYGYATDESICLNTEYVGWTTTSGYYHHAYCHTNDWMWKSSSGYWTMTPYFF